MMVLAIDIGTKMGYAYQEDDSGLIESGMFNFTPRKGAHPGQRFLEWQGALDSELPTPDEIVYEQVRRHMGTRAAHVYGGFVAILEAWAAEMQIPIKGIGVTSIKKHATGSGSAQKPEMIVAACRITGREITDDNEADAICLLDLEQST